MFLIILFMLSYPALPPRIAVIIPCYRVRKHILDVLKNIPDYVECVYVVDDACPEDSGDFVSQQNSDKRVVVIKHLENQGVGGAVMTGYQAAIRDGLEILIKIDGDNQMDPSLISTFIAPIITGDADYTKGNRFFDLENLQQMPRLRIFGNAILSFMSKLSTGYWHLFDPTNGFTAIHSKVAAHLPLPKISHRYFFETDMLFRLNILGAVVVDIPMSAKYSDEVSGLKVSKIVGEFLLKHIKNFSKRIFYNYYLRDMSLASIELPLGVLFFCFGVIHGLYHWVDSASVNITTPAGTVMLSALPLLVGVQLILGFFAYDMGATPTTPVHPKISGLV